MALLVVGLIPCPAGAASVTLAWDPSPEPEALGYLLHQGPESGVYTSAVDVGTANSWTVSDLADGECRYLAVTAYDWNANWSGYSNEVAYCAPLPEAVDRPLPPAGPASVEAGVPAVFSARGLVSSFGDAVQYRFLWADGTDSDWLPVGVIEAAKTWDTPGTYGDIRLHARCAEHPLVESPLSDPVTITVHPVPPEPAPETAPGPSAERLAAEPPPNSTEEVSVPPTPVDDYGPPLFADRFSRDAIDGDPRWLSLSGHWRVGPDEALASADLASINRAVVRALPEISAGRISTRFRLTRRSRARGAGVVFSLSDVRDFRYVSMRRSRISIGQRGACPGEEPGVKASANRAFRAGRWYQLRIDMHPDGLVSVFLGRATKPVLSYRFADTVAGRVGVLAQKSAASFDDFTVWDATVLP